jgi:GYD domain
MGLHIAAPRNPITGLRGKNRNSSSRNASMQTFAMLTRLEPNGLQSPTAVEDLEHRVMEHVRMACPTAHWIGSYAVCGPYDYLDLFRADSLDDATKISALVRSYGHAHTELWPLTEWSHFKTLIHELGLVRG